MEMTIFIMKLVQTAWPKNSTINNNTTETEVVYYALYGAAIIAAAVIVVCCIVLPLYNQFLLYSVATALLRYMPLLYIQSKYLVFFIEQQFFAIVSFERLGLPFGRVLNEEEI